MHTNQFALFSKLIEEKKQHSGFPSIDYTSKHQTRNKFNLIVEIEVINCLDVPLILPPELCWEILHK